MKKVPLTIGLLLLIGCLFFSKGVLSHGTIKVSPPNSSFLPKNTWIEPDTYLPFHNFLNLYSFSHNVCRKPLTETMLWPSTNTFYHFKRFSTFRTQPLGTTSFLKVNGSLTYKKGNSYLLIPQSFVVPTKAGLQPKRPLITLPGSSN